MANVEISADRLAEFCRRWKIAELALFGSALHGELREDSDIDLLVSFERDAGWSLFDQVRMQDQLCGLLGRKVDLVSRRGIERSRNFVRRKAILESAEVIYGAA